MITLKTKLELLVRWITPLFVILFWLGYQYEHDPRLQKYKIMLEQKEQQLQQYRQDQEEIEKTIREMRKYRPNATRQEACVFVGKQKAFGLPGKVARLSAAAETEFNMNAVGIFGERGTHQAMWFTKEAYFPGTPDKLIYYEVASWLYLKECYERAGRQPILTVAYHNSGYNRTPASAYRAAWRHVSRCRRILRGMGT